MYLSFCEMSCILEVGMDTFPIVQNNPIDSLSVLVLKILKFSGK